MARHQKTLRLLETAMEVLSANNPMTVRQVYYQLVSRQVIENNRSAYQAVSNLLVDARKEGSVPWDWIEDRLRRPRAVSMWEGLPDFAETVRRAYRRDVWASQPGYVECWLEKDALSGIFEDVLRAYGVTLNVGRGYDGWDSIRNAALRYQGRENVTVLYFGDFDPSGEDMVRSLRERIAFFDCHPEILKCALTKEDVERYQLPPDLTKATDSRRAAFVKKYGDISVELDALPVDVLRGRLVREVEDRMDLRALARVRKVEGKERAKLVKLLAGDGRAAMSRSRSTRAWTMEITDVQFKAASRSDCERGLLGWTSFALDGRLRLEGVAVRRTLDGRVALSFPARQDGRHRRHFYVRPLDDCTRREIEGQVLAALGFEVRT